MKTFNYAKLIPYVIILILIGIIVYFSNKRSKLEENLTSEIKFRTALIDTVKQYKNNRNELVSEKKTLQVTISTLQKVNGNLNATQKELLDRIEHGKKDNTIISAALVQTTAKLDSLLKSKVTVDTLKNSVTFTNKTEFLNYKLRVDNVKQVVNKIPNLTFENFELYNKQYIEFNWKNSSKEGYPVSFNITNTNPYYKVNNVESYIIPEISKVEIKPTFWQKLGKGMKTVGGKAIYIGLGFGAALLLVK